MQRERKQMLRNAETARKLREAEAGIERARLDRIKQNMQRILLRDGAGGFSSWRAAVAGLTVYYSHHRHNESTTRLHSPLHSPLNSPVVLSFYRPPPVKTTHVFCALR